VSSDSEREALAAKFERHADEEGKILLEYRALAEKLGNSCAGNLVSHILTEEELHHLLLRTMAEWMRERPAELERGIPPDADRPNLVRLTQLLQMHERKTIDECRATRAQLSGDNAELFSTLLEAMVLDSEKHHRLLDAVERLLRLGWR
jgi:bacterioferritin (cytochrome b1)